MTGKTIGQTITLRQGSQRTEPVHGDYAAEWSGVSFDPPLQLVRRDSLRPGDVAHSSHYGRRTVRAMAIFGKSAQLRWEMPEGAHNSEVYAAASLIPLYHRAGEEPAAREYDGRWAKANATRHEGDGPYPDWYESPQLPPLTREQITEAEDEVNAIIQRLRDDGVLVGIEHRHGHLHVVAWRHSGEVE